MAYDFEYSEKIQRQKDARFIRDCANRVANYDRLKLNDLYDHERNHAKAQMRSDMKKLVNIAMNYIDT